MTQLHAISCYHKYIGNAILGKKSCQNHLAKKRKTKTKQKTKTKTNKKKTKQLTSMHFFSELAKKMHRS